MRKLKQVKQSPGLMTCIFEHEIKDSKASYEWEGPKMNMPSDQWWKEVLAFFEWTQKEHCSEAQVRLYVNATEGRWAAWAFPQRGGTGMTTREVDDHPKMAEQRAQFGNGWVYYGTVHHHCSGSAFQSGTDTQNEISQDGLHITIGKVGHARYDIHYRVYQSGYELTSVKMDNFWDVTAIKATIPPHVLAMLPDDANVRLALMEMTAAALPDQTFPEVWKENYIIPPPPKTITYGQQMGLGMSNHWSGEFHGSIRRLYTKRCGPPLEFDIRRASREILHLITELEVDNLNDTTKPDVELETIADLVEEVFIKSQMAEWEMDVLDIVMHNDLKPLKFWELLQLMIKMRDDEIARNHSGQTRASVPVKQLTLPVQKEVGLPTEADERSAMDHEGGGYYGAGFGM